MQLSMLEEEGRDIASGEIPLEARAAAKEMKEILAQAMEGMPAEFREVYEMRDVKELPGAEVAKRLGISQAAMKSRLHRARGILRERLDAALLR